MMRAVMALLLLCAAACEPGPGTGPEPGAGAGRVWDFEHSREVSQVPWPNDPARRTSHSVDARGEVTVRFGPGLVFRRHVERIEFVRRGDEVRLVKFVLESQSAADTYRTARELADQWDVPQADVDEWFAAAKAGHDVYGHAARRGTFPVVDLEIFGRPEPQRPYGIVLQVGWVGAATQPTTAATAPHSQTGGR